MRVYAVVREEIVHLVDDRAKVMGITRSLWISKAIESYLHPQGDDRITRGDDGIISGDDKITQEVTTLKAQLAETMVEADHLRGDLQVKEGDLSRLKTDAELKWRETSQLRSEVSQARRELESTRAKIDHLQTELDKKRTEIEQARIEAEALRHDQDHYKSTLELKDKQIGFLEGHVAQLTQSISQLALKPGEEEIKKKGWWRFW
jgi:chromosome segregation ATPase